MKSRETKISVVYVLILINMTIMVSDYKAWCNKIGAACTILLIPLMLISDNGKLGSTKYENRLLISVFLFLGYYVITSFIYGQIPDIVESILYYLIEFSSIFIFLYYLKRNGLTNQRWLIYSFFIVWDVFCILAIASYIKSPNLARLMAAYRASYSSLIIGGGYPMAYGSAILGVYLFQTLIERISSNRVYRLFAIIEIALLTVLVYYTNSFIILVAMLLGYVLCIFRYVLDGKLFFISMILLFLFVIIVYYNIDAILKWMIEINNNEFLERRLVELYDLAANDVSSYHLSKRSDLYEMSFKSFCSHPFFGVGYQFGNLGSLQRLNGVGAHSTILDTLAQYGIVGAVPVFYMIIYPLLYNKRKGINSVYLMVYLFMLLLNPCFTVYHCILVVYLIIPIIQEVISNKVQRD